LPAAVSTPWRGIAYGLGYACYIYTFYITVWRAVFRLIRRRNGWSKTRRNTEQDNSKVVALDRWTVHYLSIRDSRALLHRETVDHL